MDNNSRILVLKFNKIKFYSVIDFKDIVKVWVDYNSKSILGYHFNDICNIDKIFSLTEDQNQKIEYNLVVYVFKKITEFIVKDMSFLILTDEDVERFYKETSNE